MLAVDMSNYTDPLTDAALQGLKDSGVSHVIVQAVDPPPPFPKGRTRDQVQVCLNADLTVDAYVWLWFELDITDIQHKLELLEGFTIRKLWLDVEDTASSQYNQADTEAKVTDALAACDAFPTASGEKTGIYSGRWFWTDRRYMANTEAFADRELWDANYDNVVDAAIGFAPYGGWLECAIKQYRGSATVAGVGGVDLNVLSIAVAQELQSEADQANAEADQPDRETPDDWRWPTWRTAAINYKAIADALGQQLADAQKQLSDLQQQTTTPGTPGGR